MAAAAVPSIEMGWAMSESAVSPELQGYLQIPSGLPVAFPFVSLIAATCSSSGAVEEGDIAVLDARGSTVKC